MPYGVITKFDGGGENVGQLRLMAPWGAGPLGRLLGRQDAAAEGRSPDRGAGGGVRWRFG